MQLKQIKFCGWHIGKSAHTLERCKPLTYFNGFLWYVRTGAWQALLYITGGGLWLRSQTPEMGKVLGKRFPFFPTNQRTELSGHMHKSHAYGENMEWVHNTNYWYRHSGKRYTYYGTYMLRHEIARLSPTKGRSVQSLQLIDQKDLNYSETNRHTHGPSTHVPVNSQHRES